jgi:hypothetical protein
MGSRSTEEAYMVKKCFLALGLLALVAGLVAAAGQTRMRSGEATIYLKSGDPVIDKIIDISSERLVLETENNGEFPLRDIWMINFIDDAWDFPQERDQLDARSHFVFLRNGGVSAGRIVDFSSERRVFEFEGGEEFPIGQVRRIYFTRNVPASLKGGGGQGGGGGSVWAGTFYRDVPSPPMEIELGDDGSARLSIETARGRTVVLRGRWTDVDGRSIRVNVRNETIASDQRTIVFGLERDTLISLSGSIGANVRLQRR